MLAFDPVSHDEGGRAGITAFISRRGGQDLSERRSDLLLIAPRLVAKLGRGAL